MVNNGKIAIVYKLKALTIYRQFTSIVRKFTTIA
nr:MAG TPA: hypothetical protein [Caudoviricetes sp.]